MQTRILYEHYNTAAIMYDKLNSLLNTRFVVHYKCLNNLYAADVPFVENPMLFTVFVYKYERNIKQVLSIIVMSLNSTNPV